MPPNPPNGHKQTIGPMNAVPCPRCGKPNDFRIVDGLGKAEDRMQEDIEKGSIASCDHCGGYFKVVDLKETTLVKLVPASEEDIPKEEDAAGE